MLDHAPANVLGRGGDFAFVAMSSCASSSCRLPAAIWSRLLDGDLRLAAGRRVRRVVRQVRHPDGRLGGDGPVHDRLRVRRLVALVVSQLAVAPQLDDRVAVEALAEVDRQIDHLRHRLGILAVDVEDRDLQHARDVGRVGRRLRVTRRGREADLVVDDDVNGAAHAVAVQLGHVQRLGDDPLPREGRVAVNQQRQAARAGAVGDAILLGAHAPLHDRVDPLEVAGVERQRHVHRVRSRIRRVGPERAIDRESQVVLHVAAARRIVRVDLVLELGEDLRRRLVQHVGEHVQAPAVGHADHDLDDARARRALDQPFQHRDQALGALQREALVAQELVLQELLEHLGADHLVQDPHPIRARQRQPVARRFHPVLQPRPQLDVVQVGQLDADGPAVRLAQQLDELAQRRAVRPGHVLAAEHQVEVLVGEPEVLERDRRQLPPHQPQRVEAGGQVAELAVSLDQALDALGQQPDRDAVAGHADAGVRRNAGAREDASLERRRWHQRRRARAVAVAVAPAQGLEGTPPRRIDAGRILEVLEVQLLHEREIREREPRQLIVGGAGGGTRRDSRAVRWQEGRRFASLAGSS